MTDHTHEDPHPAVSHDQDGFKAWLKKHARLAVGIAFLAFACLFGMVSIARHEPAAVITTQQAAPDSTTADPQKQIAELKGKLDVATGGVKKVAGIDDTPAHKPMAQRLAEMTPDEKAELNKLLGKKAELMLRSEGQGDEPKGHIGVAKGELPVPTGCTSRQVLDQETHFYHVRVFCPPGVKYNVPSID